MLLSWHNVERVAHAEDTTIQRTDVGLSENVVYPEKPNGFADHYPVFKWLFHWGYTPFSDIHYPY